MSITEINRAFDKMEGSWEALESLYEEGSISKELIDDFNQAFSQWVGTLREMWPESSGLKPIDGRLVNGGDHDGG